MDRIQLTKNFYLDEFQVSQTAVRHGIDMSIQEGGIFHHNLKHLCVNVMQPVRDHFGPVVVLSGYRPTKLNRLIGGSGTSQHVTAQAGDFNVPGHSPLKVAKWIRDNCDGYDQLIHEFGRWVHCSVPAINKVPRLQCLTAMKRKGAFGRMKTVYFNGLLEIVEA